MFSRSPSPLRQDAEIADPPKAFFREVHRDTGQTASGPVDVRRHHAFLPQRREEEASKKGLLPVFSPCREVFCLSAFDFKFFDLAARDLFSQGFPVFTGIRLSLPQDGLDLFPPGAYGFPVIPVFLKAFPRSPQVLHRFNHLREGMQIVLRIVLDNHPIPAPRREIFILHEAVIRQMPGPPVSEIHNRGFIRLKQAVGEDSRLQIIRFAGAVPESDFSLRSVGKQFKEIIVRVVDHERRCSGKPAVGPGVRQHMHGDPHRLRAVSLRQLYRAFDQRSVWAADQAEFIPVQPGTAFLFRPEIVWQEMERGPDSGDILQPCKVRSRIRHLHGQLGCRR